MDLNDDKNIETAKEIIASEIAKAGYQADRIILFGSRAKGDNREDSDYDFFVVLAAGTSPEGRNLLKRAIDNKSAKLPICIQTHIKSLEDLTSDNNVGGLTYYALKYGITLAGNTKKPALSSAKQRLETAISIFRHAEEHMRSATKSLSMLKGLKETSVTSVLYFMHLAAERYLHAYLVLKGREIDTQRIYIERIVEECSKLDKDFDRLRNIGVEKLTMHFIAIDKTDIYYEAKLKYEDAKEAVFIAKKIRDLVVEKTKGKLLKKDKYLRLYDRPGTNRRA